MSLERVADRDVGLAVALFAGAAAILLNRQALLLAAALGLLYSAYRAVTPVPRPEIQFERALSTTSPLPGERVEVTVTVRNEGLDPLHDLRVIDGVPPRLAVVEGSPRFGTALEPGESASFTYALRARRGDHAFEETTVICRSLTGDVEYRETVHAAADLSCRVTVEEMPLGTQTLPYPGRVETDDPGNGVSFYSVREYESADPMRRVDWNRFARTRELATVEYEARQTAAVVLLVDTRLAFAPTDRSPTATQFAKYAAERVGSALLGEHNQVGAALFDAGTYLPPGTGRTQVLRLRRLLVHERHPDAVSSDESLGEGFDGRLFLRADAADASGESATAGDGGSVVARLHRRMAAGAQVVFCTPLLDDRAERAVAALDAHGRDVTVVSPDLTRYTTPGNAVERIERSARVERLRRTARVVDWDTRSSLPRAIERATAGWSR